MNIRLGVGGSKWTAGGNERSGRLVIDGLEWAPGGRLGIDGSLDSWELAAVRTALEEQLWMTGLCERLVMNEWEDRWEAENVWQVGRLVMDSWMCGCGGRLRVDAWM